MKNSVQPSTNRRIGASPGFWSKHRTWAFCILHFAFCVCPRLAQAFPPAPDGLIYGVIKDQYGTPLMHAGDRVVLTTSAGIQAVGLVQPGLAIGINYALVVPIDAGVTPDPYVPNALVAGAQFKLTVAIGTVTNLPIEMLGANLVLAAGGLSTRQDLTLGTDANGDGIPDEWEQVFLAEAGRTNLSLANLNANGIYTADGRTLRQEFLLGNYPYNPTNEFSVQLLSQNAGSAVLGFNTIVGRTYAVSGSADLAHWMPLAFTIPAQGMAPSTNYYASSIQPLQIQTLQPTNAPTVQFFRLQLE
jgi:hypothetical protein